MRKPYYTIIDECIDQFRLEDGRTFNLSLLDFREEVFNNFGRKPPLGPQEITHLLAHAQKIIADFGRENPAVQRVTQFLSKDLRLLPPSDDRVRAIAEIIFEGDSTSRVQGITSNHIARFISLLPLKYYWDNSGAIYKRAYEVERFTSVYLYQYYYENHRRPADVVCREIEIPEYETNVEVLEQKLEELARQPFRRNAEYLGLLPEDEMLYDLYGQLFDLLNWGASNPEGIINYLDSRTQAFSFYNCVFPLVFHGIYYGIAYFDLPPEFFSPANNAAVKLRRLLEKGWTYVNHYFPAAIIDAYNSRLISRFTRSDLSVAEDVITLVNSKIPFHFCYDQQNEILYYFKFVSGEIAKFIKKQKYHFELADNLTALRQKLASTGLAVDPDQLHFVHQPILDHDLVFAFDMRLLPGRNKSLPILESHLGQAAFVLETMKDQREYELYEERTRILNMFAHDAKTTQELLISDLEEGMDSDLAALQLREQGRKERVMRNYLLGRHGVLGNEPFNHPEQQINLQDLFVDQFCKSWRGWLKSRRFRESFRRNRHPSLPLSCESSKLEAERFIEQNFQKYSGQPGRACLEILRASFRELSPSAEISVVAPPLILAEHATIRVEEILYNLLCNFFKHAAPSPLTGFNECAIKLNATPAPQGIYFQFSFSNSTSTKERFEEDLKELWRYGHEIHGLQIIRYLLEADAGEIQPELEIWQEDYIWHINIGRVCHGCRQNTLVDPGA
jgi:hypothetical protein